jgi:hypothetical protein
MAAGISATLVAHGVTYGGLSIIPAAPALWASLVCMAILCGRRVGRFHARGPLRIFAGLLVTQGLLHGALAAAPWAFGVSVHHQLAPLTTTGVVTHIAAACVLAILVARAEIVLAACLLAIRVIRQLVGERRPSRRHSLVQRFVDEASVATTRPLVGSNPVRGPPLSA